MRRRGVVWPSHFWQHACSSHFQDVRRDHGTPWGRRRAQHAHKTSSAWQRSARWPVQTLRIKKARIALNDEKPCRRATSSTPSLGGACLQTRPLGGLSLRAARSRLARACRDRDRVRVLRGPRARALPSRSRASATVQARHFRRSFRETRTWAAGCGGCVRARHSG